MKQLTEQAVQTTMDLLIHTNRSTTTLDIKNSLRALGYFAEQATVSKMVEDIFDNTDCFIRDNSTTSYYVYSWTIAHEMMIGGYADGIAVDDDDDHITIGGMHGSAPTFSYAIGNVGGSKALHATTTSTPLGVSREPMNIYYTDQHAQNHIGKQDEWVVFYKNQNSEIHIYNGTLSRDNVRSKYASLVGKRIQDVRAKRLSNYIK